MFFFNHSNTFVQAKEAARHRIFICAKCLKEISKQTSLHLVAIILVTGLCSRVLWGRYRDPQRTCVCIFSSGLRSLVEGIKS